MLSPGLGFVVIGGHRSEIDRLWLGRDRDGNGSVLIQFTLAGPLPAIEGNITVFGADECGIVQGRILSFPPLGQDDVWTCEYGLRIAWVDASDAIRFGPAGQQA